MRWSVVVTSAVAGLILSTSADAVPTWSTAADVAIVKFDNGDFFEPTLYGDTEQDLATANAEVSLPNASGAARATIDPSPGFMMSVGAAASLTDDFDETTAYQMTSFARAIDTFVFADPGSARTLDVTLAIDGTTDRVYGKEPDGLFLHDAPVGCAGVLSAPCTMGWVGFVVDAGAGDSLTGEQFSTSFLLEDLFNGDGSFSGAVSMPLSFDVSANAEWLQVRMDLSVARFFEEGEEGFSENFGTTDFLSTLSFGFSDPTLFSARASGAPLSAASVPEPATLALLVTGCGVGVARRRYGSCRRTDHASSLSDLAAS